MARELIAALLLLFSLLSGATAQAWPAAAPLPEARTHARATKLPDGRVLVTGGMDPQGVRKSTAWLYRPTEGTWSLTQQMSTPRSLHTSTLLHDGRVLVVGGEENEGGELKSAELFDPSLNNGEGGWTAAPNMATPRVNHTATLLPDGRVLILGGFSSHHGGQLSSAEVFEPRTGTWRSFPDVLKVRRASHSALLLKDGRVLVTAGYTRNRHLKTTELCTLPSTGNPVCTTKAIGALASEHPGQSATTLRDGRVLVFGGTSQGELFNPATHTWSLTAASNHARRAHTATLLPSGKVLLVGGYVAGSPDARLSNAELFDPASNKWTLVPETLVSDRTGHVSVLLASGDVLVAGGYSESGGWGAVATAEKFLCHPQPHSLRHNASEPRPGPMEWPDACWRPFENDSNPFNREIPPSAKVHQVRPDSGEIVGFMLDSWRSGEFQGRLDGHSGEPTYYTHPTAPEYLIRCMNDPYGATTCAPAAEGQTLRLPSWALPEGGAPVVPGTATNPGHDGHLTVIDTARGLEWDFYQVQSDPRTSSTLIASYANAISLTSNGLYSPGDTSRAGTAARWANLLGRVRLEELQAGEIRHALFMHIACHNGVDGPARDQPAGQAHTGVVYPAAGPGTRCVDSGAQAPPLGAHFFYDRSPEEIDRLPIKEWRKTILKALSRYGAFAGDTTSGYWGFEQESSYQYASTAGGERRWYDFGAANGWSRYLGDESDPGDRFFDEFYDLDPSTKRPTAEAEAMELRKYLKILNPCVSQGTCR